MTTGAYFAVSQGFDRLAPRYDELIESNPLHAHLRVRSLAWLDEAFRPGMRVLEIGCGVGTEVVHLAGRGVEVTATDVSQAMVDLTQERVRTHGVQERVHVVRCAAGEISTRFDSASFDGAYASFGPLNCEPDLRQAFGEIAAVMKPGSNLLTSIVSRPCVMEMTAAAAHLAFRKAFRRLSEATSIDLNGTGAVTVRAYSEGEIRRSLGAWFRIERLEGWLVALPPPYLAEAWERVRILHRPLERADERLHNRWPFRGLGDHLHVWARKVGS